MRIRSDIVKKYWHEAAIADLASTYTTKGYKVEKDAKVGDYEADLVLKKDNELIVIEVKSGAWPEEKTAEVQSIRNEVVHKLGGKFNLVLVSPPPQETVNEIEGLEDILFELLAEEGTYRDDLDILSSLTIIEDVSDVVLSSLSIEKNRLHAQGVATVSVSLNWGSSSDYEKDNGLTDTDSFPLDFDIVLDGNLKIVEVIKLEVNTASHYK